MKTKQFKIGEYAIGGIIRVIIDGYRIIISAIDWNTKKVIEESEFDRDYIQTSSDITDFLEVLTTSYYAEKIQNWINLNTAEK